MSKELIERLRNGIGMPALDDGAFHWYAAITDEAAERIEELEQQVTELVAALESLVIHGNTATSGEIEAAAEALAKVRKP